MGEGDPSSSHFLFYLLFFLIHFFWPLTISLSPFPEELGPVPESNQLDTSIYWINTGFSHIGKFLLTFHFLLLPLHYWHPRFLCTRGRTESNEWDIDFIRRIRGPGLRNRPYVRSWINKPRSSVHGSRKEKQCCRVINTQYPYERIGH